MSVNKVILLGRLGQDPELRYISSGAAVCNFSLATNEVWVDKNGQKQEKTEWHRIVIWGKQAEHCNQYLRKGSQVFIDGKIQTRQWEDQNGQKRYTTEVNANNVQFLGGRDAAQSQNSMGGMSHDRMEPQRPASATPEMAPSADSYNVSTETNFTADDIPF